MCTHDEIMAESARARRDARSESGIWSEGTPYSADELEGLYEDYVVCQLEAGNDYVGFPDWCETIMGIADETPE